MSPLSPRDWLGSPLLVATTFALKSSINTCCSLRFRPYTCACVSVTMEKGEGGRAFYLHFQHFLKVGGICVTVHELCVACNELLSLLMWGHDNLQRKTANRRKWPWDSYPREKRTQECCNDTTGLNKSALQPYLDDKFSSLHSLWYKLRIPATSTQQFTRCLYTNTLHISLCTHDLRWRSFSCYSCPNWG